MAYASRRRLLSQKIVEDDLRRERFRDPDTLPTSFTSGWRSRPRKRASSPDVTIVGRGQVQRELENEIFQLQQEVSELKDQNKVGRLDYSKLRNKIKVEVQREVFSAEREVASAQQKLQRQKRRLLLNINNTMSIQTPVKYEAGQRSEEFKSLEKSCTRKCSRCGEEMSPLLYSTYQFDRKKPGLSFCMACTKSTKKSPEKGALEELVISKMAKRKGQFAVRELWKEVYRQNQGHEAITKAAEAMFVQLKKIEEDDSATLSEEKSRYLTNFRQNKPPSASDVYKYYNLQSLVCDSNQRRFPDGVELVATLGDPEKAHTPPHEEKAQEQEKKAQEQEESSGASSKRKASATKNHARLLEHSTQDKERELQRAQQQQQQRAEILNMSELKDVHSMSWNEMKHELLNRFLTCRSSCR